MLKKLKGSDPFKGKTANCLVCSDATLAHSIIDYFEWAYTDYGGRMGNVIAIGDMAIKPAPTPMELANIIVESISTYKLVVGREPIVALIAHDEVAADKLHKAVQALPNSVKLYFYSIEAMQLKDALLTESNLFIYSELAYGNPAYKAWQILNPGFFVTQGFDSPVCDLSRGDSSSEKIKSTIAYLALQAFQNQ